MRSGSPLNPIIPSCDNEFVLLWDEDLQKKIPYETDEYVSEKVEDKISEFIRYARSELCETMEAILENGQA